jgi:hypothetical protein
MNCRGIHCDGCGSGGGPALGLVVILVIAATVAMSKARAIGHAAAVVGHVLVLIIAAGASVALASAGLAALLIIRGKLCRIERATGRMQDTLTGHGPRELAEPRAGLPARSDIPAKVFIHPPTDRERVS